MCSRSAPPQAIVTNDSTGSLCCHFSVDVVLDGADDLAGNDVLAVYCFLAILLPSWQWFQRHVVMISFCVFLRRISCRNASRLASLKGACDISD